MTSFGLSYFDKALDSVIDGLENSVVDRTRAIASDLLSEEYKAPVQQPVLQTDAPGVLNNLNDVTGYWRLFNIQEKKAELARRRAEFQAPHDDRGAAALQRRAEQAEKAYCELAGMLSQAPDPLPFLNSLLPLQKSLSELQKENKRLQLYSKAAESEASSASGVVLRNRDLEKRVAELEAELKEKVEKESQVHEDLTNVEEVKREAEQQQQQYVHQIKRLQDDLASLQAEHERAQSQLFDLREQKEAASNVVASAADLAAEEHEALGLRVRSLELEKCLLEKRIEGLLTDTRDHGFLSAAAEDSVTPRAADAIRLLRQRVEQTGQQLQDAEARHAEEIAAAHADLQRAATRCTELQAELDSRAGPEEVAALRARIEALRHLVDAQEEAEGAGEESATGAASSSSAASLHAVLQARNRRLASDAQSLQQQLRAKDDAMAQMQDRLAGLEQEVRQKAALVQSLEADLLNASQNAGGMQGPVGPAANAPSEGGTSKEPHTSGGASASLLGIVTSQRDRFRGRVEQLEGEMGAVRGELAAARNDLAAARADNVKLYEKIRYLQRFSGKQASSDGFQVVQVDSEGISHPKASQQHRLQCGPVHINLGGGSASPERDARPATGPSASPAQLRARIGRRRSACFGLVEADDEEAAHSAVEQRYLKAYEARFNPFAEFQQNEEVSRTKSLPVHDRAILTGSRLLLQNKVGRIFAAVYLTLIHVFVSVLIFYAALSSQPITSSSVSEIGPVGSSS
ncbi:probable protein CASP [Coccomyxa sp. Obi]|nr:probable protein CASP [Coccomyxa sp. Obi]